MYIFPYTFFRKWTVFVYVIISLRLSEPALTRVISISFGPGDGRARTQRLCLSRFEIEIEGGISQGRNYVCMNDEGEDGPAVVHV